MAEHLLAEDTKLVHQALANIATTTAELARQAIEMGAAGVYFATQMSSYDKLTAEEYRNYGVPYDLQVLTGAEAGWFNAIHAHGENIMFDLLKDYPVHVFNWHIGETLPELKEGMDYTGKCVMGGIVRMDITHNNFNEMRSQIYRSVMMTQGQRLILTPSCGIRHPYEETRIQFIQKVIKETEAFIK